MAARTNTNPLYVEPRVRDRWFNTSRVGTLVFGESLTKQEFKEECDINHILARLQDGPPRPWTNPPQLQYGDYANAPDFLNAQLLVKQAEDQFNALPAVARTRFRNDPATFLAFLNDPKNLDEARKLGLAKPAPVAPPPPPPSTETPK
jgi:hypothetical protein